jgi:hypothetical protein
LQILLLLFSAPLFPPTPPFGVTIVITVLVVVFDRFASVSPTTGGG